MSEQMATFPYRQPLVIDQEDTILLTSDTYLASLEESSRQADESLEWARAGYETAKAQRAREEISVEGLQTAEGEYYGALAKSTSIKQGLDKAKGHRERLADRTLFVGFDMRRYGYNDKKECEDACATIGPNMMPVVKKGDLTLQLLTRCLAAWEIPTECGRLWRMKTKDGKPVAELQDAPDVLRADMVPITLDNIGKLPPRLVEILDEELKWRSEPTEERLSFLA